MQDTRIALAICNAKIGATQENIDKAATYVQQAVQAEADIICFPELTVTGYTNRDGVSAVAETVPGPSSERLSHLAAASKILVLAGLAEKDAADRIFASHLVCYPDGRVDVYRKIHIAPPERHLYSPGDQVPLFNFKGLRFGIQLCYDAHFPELSTRMALSGAELVFIPHASPRGRAPEKHRSWMRHLSARAFDNGIFIAACNQTGQNGAGLTFPGNALVIGPSGNLVMKYTGGRETLQLVDLSAGDLETVRRSRMRFFLPFRRPDLYGPLCCEAGIENACSAAAPIRKPSAESIAKSPHVRSRT